MPNERMDMDENVEEPAFGPAALGLHRVGTILPPKAQPQLPIQVLNARGMPARIRKRNKLFFDDVVVNDTKTIRQSPIKRIVKQSPSPVKQPVAASPSKHLKKRKGVVTKFLLTPPSKVSTASPDTKRSHCAAKDSSSKVSEDDLNKQSALDDTAQASDSNAAATSALNRVVGQKIGLRLRNLLKLPKAHKWVSFEWFYSYIDQPLLLGENDFQICLKESFPQLKTNLLTRIEWSKVRRLMGKPRRCSQAFFDEERLELKRRRQKIRLLQSRKSGDLSFVRDLPKEIPLILPVGTKVTARLRDPQDGIFTGMIEAIYSMSSEYRVAFDRPGIGTHSIPDYEIFVNDHIDTINVSSVTQNFRQKINGLCYVPSPIASVTKFNRSDPLLGSSVLDAAQQKFKNFTLPKETIGGYQLKLLELIVRARKTIATKQLKLMRLKNMNDEAEMYKSYNESFPEDYQKRYASIVIGMEKLNKDNKQYLSEIQIHARKMTKDSKLMALLEPSYLREKCKEMGIEAIKKNNLAIGKENASIIGLLNNLATIMYIASNLLTCDQSYHISKVMEGVLEQTKQRVDPENIGAFQANVYAHIRHLEMDLGLH